jgi:hypothetical protein
VHLASVPRRVQRLEGRAPDDEQPALRDPEVAEAVLLGDRSERAQRERPGGISMLDPRYMQVLYPHPEVERASAAAAPQLTAMLDSIAKSTARRTARGAEGRLPGTLHGLFNSPLISASYFVSSPTSNPVCVYRTTPTASTM